MTGGTTSLGPSNNIGHHQTMFFGPAHSLAQYGSLPRRTTPMTSAFQRNTPIRRSTGIPEHHIEYFVPRSISEFNLSGVGDLALPPPRRGALGLPHGIQMGPPQTLICTAPQPQPQQMQILLKPREKMVTFEDESKVLSSPASVVTSTSAGTGTTLCPHGVPTTPRKSTTLAGNGADVFM